ncbi:hypothetical protein FH972_025983 [Carpinus fangiana]|uniref:Uncharacterized protein n=1 Tax=Carpinus fangiana TaxID=176857 RepID=A0A5N6L2L5_9ROSI|nr:hypothetical protein FH972_025983 [Carpinus fangiana]
MQASQASHIAHGVARNFSVLECARRWCIWRNLLYSLVEMNTQCPSIAHRWQARWKVAPLGRALPLSGHDSMAYYDPSMSDLRQAPNNGGAENTPEAHSRARISSAAVATVAAGSSRFISALDQKCKRHPDTAPYRNGLDIKNIPGLGAGSSGGSKGGLGSDLASVGGPPPLDSAQWVQQESCMSCPALHDALIAHCDGPASSRADISRGQLARTTRADSALKRESYRQRFEPAGNWKMYTHQKKATSYKLQAICIWIYIADWKNFRSAESIRLQAMRLSYVLVFCSSFSLLLATGPTESSITVEAISFSPFFKIASSRAFARLSLSPQQVSATPSTPSPLQFPLPHTIPELLHQSSATLHPSGTLVAYTILDYLRPSTSTAMSSEDLYEAAMALPEFSMQDPSPVQPRPSEMDPREPVAFLQQPRPVLAATYSDQLLPRIQLPNALHPPIVAEYDISSYGIVNGQVMVTQWEESLHQGPKDHAIYQCWSQKLADSSRVYYCPCPDKYAKKQSFYQVWNYFHGHLIHDHHMDEKRIEVLKTYDLIWSVPGDQLFKRYKDIWQMLSSQTA